ncbi:MAG: amidohydrolase family protein [Longimicrobiales bacterium]
MISALQGTRPTAGGAIPERSGRRLPVAALAVLALAWPGPDLRAQSDVVAFQHVNVLAMDRERVLEDHTVLIRGEVIQEVAPSHRVTVPEDATVYDGEGRFLIPGLGDMFVRLPGPGASDEEVEEFMFLLLANNVTTARGGVGLPHHLTLKRQVQTGQLLGPTLYVAAPVLDESNTRDPDAAVELLLAHRATGYDFQKTGRGIPLMSWDSMAEEAHSRGYTFGGLIPDSVGLRYALSTGISFVDHLDGYLQEVVADPLEARLENGEDIPLRVLLENAVGRKMRAMAAHTRSADTWVAPTLRSWEILYQPPDPDAMLALPEMRYVSPATRSRWIGQSAGSSGVDPETGRLMAEVRRRILRALVMSGSGVLLGTDAPGRFNVPGFAVRHEAESMAAAGLTPYEVLVTATRNVAEYAGRELREAGNFGIIAPGNRADLILLQGNPFEDLDQLWNQEGVMVRGRWISREEIQGRLARIAERNRG